MGKYLLLCRIKYEDGVIEPVYKWFSGADKMENYTVSYTHLTLPTIRLV